MQPAQKNHIRALAQLRPHLAHRGPRRAALDCELARIDPIGQHKAGAAIPRPALGCFIGGGIVPRRHGLPHQAAPKGDIRLLHPARLAKAITVQQPARPQHHRHCRRPSCLQRRMHRIGKDRMEVRHIAVPQTAPGRARVSRRVGQSIRPIDPRPNHLSLDLGALLAVAFALVGGEHANLMSRCRLPFDECTNDLGRPAALAGQTGNNVQDFHLELRRLTNSACSGLARPCWRTCRTAARSPRTSAAASSHKPGKTSLRCHPSTPASNRT